MQFLRVLALAILTATILAGCTQPQSPTTGIPRGQTTIGPQGGFLTTQNEEATIYIPEGTLTEDRLITIRVVDEITVPTGYGTRVSPVVEITPRNLMLNGRVQVTLNVSEGTLSSSLNYDESTFSIIYGDEGDWQPAEEVVHLTRSNQVQGEIESLGMTWAARTSSDTFASLPFSSPISVSDCPGLRITQGYGAVDEGISSNALPLPGHRHHPSLDFGGACGGQEVRSVAPATLHRVMRYKVPLNRGLGNVVELRIRLPGKPDVFARYAHLANGAQFDAVWNRADESPACVAENSWSYRCDAGPEAVHYPRGAVIGLVGGTGTKGEGSFLPHLDFALKSFPDVIHTIEDGSRTVDATIAYSYAHPDTYNYLDPSRYLYAVTPEAEPYVVSAMEDLEVFYLPSSLNPGGSRQKAPPFSVIASGTPLLVVGKFKSAGDPECNNWVQVGRSLVHSAPDTDAQKVDLQPKSADGNYVEGVNMLEYSFPIIKEGTPTGGYVRYGWVCGDHLSQPEDPRIDEVVFWAEIDGHVVVYNIIVNGTAAEYSCKLDKRYAPRYLEFDCENGRRHRMAHAYVETLNATFTASIAVEVGNQVERRELSVTVPHFPVCVGVGPLSGGCTPGPEPDPNPDPEPEPDPTPDPDPEPEPEPVLTINNFSVTVSNGFEARFTGSNTGTDSSSIRCRITYGDGDRSSWFSCGGSSWNRSYTYDAAQTFTATLDVEMGELTDSRQVAVNVPGIDEPDPVAPEITQFRVSPTSLEGSGDVDVSWRANDAEWCTLVVDRGGSTYESHEYDPCSSRNADTIYLDAAGTYTFFFGAVNYEGNVVYQPAPTVTVTNPQAAGPRITGFDPPEITALNSRQFIVIFGTNFHVDSVVTAIAPTGIRYPIPPERTVHYGVNYGMAINAQLDEVGVWYIEVSNSAGTDERALRAW